LNTPAYSYNTRVTLPTSPVAAPLIALTEDGEVAFNHGGRSRAAVRDEIIRLTERMLATPAGDQLAMDVKHEIVDGLYVRRLFIPKGTLLVGQVHRKTCVNIVEQGDISVLTEFGSRRCKPGFTGISKAGIQKLGYAHEDTVFVNVFRTDEIDINKIEQEIACKSHDYLLAEEEEEGI
jgi:hypothetical protein